MHTKQIQDILDYLGYPLSNDGHCGPMTTAAIRQYQQDRKLDPDGIAGKETQADMAKAVADGWFRPMAGHPPEASGDNSNWWPGVQYFTRHEFRCPCGHCNGFPVEPQKELVLQCDGIRHELGSPVVIVPPDGHSGGSGVRCQAYNDSLSGSVPDSYHVKGKAADIHVKVSATTIETILRRRQAEGQIRKWYRISSGAYHFEVF